MWGLLRGAPLRAADTLQSKGLWVIDGLEREITDLTLIVDTEGRYPCSESPQLSQLPPFFPLTPSKKKSFLCRIDVLVDSSYLLSS